MARKWLAQLLMTLIVLQSVVAMADAHQLHQSGIQHLEFEHEHGTSHLNEGGSTEGDPNSSLAFDITGADTNSADIKYDCHHCCHCHSAASFVLAVSNVLLDSTRAGQLPSPYYFSYRSALISPDLRPPIT